MTTGKLLTAAILVIGLLCVLIWIDGGFQSKVPAGSAGSIKSAKAVASRMVGEVTVPGTVVARDTATIFSRVSGHVTQLDVDAGSHVEKGEVLLRLETKELAERETQAAAAFESAKVDRDKAAGDLDRSKALLDSQSIAKTEFEEVRARYEAAKVLEERAKAALEEAKTQLSYGQVAAPFDGIVLKREVNTGDLADAGNPLLILYKPDSLELVAAASEPYRAYLAPGAPVIVTVDATGVKQASSLREVLTQGDGKALTITVKAPLAAHEGLRPGLSGTLIFFSKASEAVTVPAQAVRTDGRLETVHVLEAGAIKIRPVKTGRKLDDGRVEIVAGLSPGEEVVVK